MSKKMMQRVLGKGLFVMMLVAIAAVTLGKVESAHAANKTIRLGETVVDFIPEAGEKIQWYKFEAGPGAMVRITMNRKNGDLVPYVALHAYNEGAFKVEAYDNGYGGTAELAMLLPTSDHGYWIEAAAVGGEGSGLFELTLATESIRDQEPVNNPTRKAAAYQVNFTVSKITCMDPQDESGWDQIKVEFGMYERPSSGGVAVDGPEAKLSAMEMTTGTTRVNFAPTRTLTVPSTSGVTLWIDIIEEDNGFRDDETLHPGKNTLTTEDLEELSHGKPVYMSYRVQETGNFWYEVVYTVQIEKLFAPDIS